MRRAGIALTIALTLLILCVILISVLIALGAQGGVDANYEIARSAANRAAEIGIKRAIEKIGQNAATSYFSDPIEAEFWNGADLPNGPLNSASADGIIANDREPFGEDIGYDGLPSILEPGFRLTSDKQPKGWKTPYNLDPGKDNWNPSGTNGPLNAENNGRYDGPIFTGSNTSIPGNGPLLIGIDPNGAGVRFVGKPGIGLRDVSLGKDQLSSVQEVTPVPGSGGGIPYNPITNSDPARDDYHPVFNSRGTEGRIRDLDGNFLLPTRENAETRWRAYLEDVGPLSSNDSALEGYCALRAIDTSMKIDLNGPSLLTARLLNTLLLTTGSAPGPITDVNAPVGRNGYGPEAADVILSAATGLDFALIPLESPQFPLLSIWPSLGNPQVDITPTKIPKKIASTIQEERNYFHQPANQLDCDAITIIKYRDRELGGKFQIISQLLEVRRPDGTLIFDDRSRADFLRLAPYLACEVWKDNGTILRRNAEPIASSQTAGALWDPQERNYVPPEPWQDILVNGHYDGSEPNGQFGFDKQPDAGEANYDFFLNPDPTGDDFHSIWNPFFIKTYTVNGKTWRIRSEKYIAQAWSPFIEQPLESHWQALRHIHHSVPSSATHYLEAAPPSAPFNFDASEGVGFPSLDPYWLNPSTSSQMQDGMSSNNLTIFDVGSDGMADPETHAMPHAVAAGEANLVAPDQSQDNFSNEAMSLGRQVCQPSQVIWGMRNPYGSEGNGHYDHYPEIGRFDYSNGQHINDMPPRFAPMFQDCDDPETCSPSFFLKPAFSPLPMGNQLVPPQWALPDDNQFVTPGEPYLDFGRDGLPFTGDPGEGDGKYTVGERYRDYGIDGRPNRYERAFANPSLDKVLAGCGLPLGVMDTEDDYHQDDFRVVRGKHYGSERNGKYDFLNEPYLDLNRDGQHFPGGYFFDLNSDGKFQNGIAKEPRAPVNVNAAPEEVLCAVIYQALIYPTAKRQDRFLLCSADQKISSLNNSIQGDDYDWHSVISVPNIQNPDILNPDLDFAYHFARGLSRAIELRRTGLYSPLDSSISAQIGSGPFRSWQEFDVFVRALISSPAETARFAKLHPVSLNPVGVGLLREPLKDPFTFSSVLAYAGGLGDPANNQPGLGYPAGADGARQLMIDRIIVQANPNTRLQGPENLPYVNSTFLDKTDFPYPTTEFCFGATGIYEVTSVGYAVAKGAPIALGSTPQNQVLGSGPISDSLMSANGVQARIERTVTVKIFEHYSFSTREDFVGSEVGSRGVVIQPNLVDVHALTPDATGTTEVLASPSDYPSKDVDDFLLVRPQVTCFDPVRGLLFVASQNSPASSNSGYHNPYNNQVDDPAGAIQVLSVDSRLLAEGKPAFKNFTRNNGQSTVVNVPDGNGNTYSAKIGVIAKGMGFSGSVPTALIRAMAFDPNFPVPSDFTAGKAYLGRLYVLDDFNMRLRILDIGRDMSGGLISVERTIFDASTIAGYFIGKRYSGVAVLLNPEKRAIHLVLRGPASQTGVFLIQLRYPEGQVFPPTTPKLDVILEKVPQAADPLPINAGMQGWISAGQPAYIGVTQDPLTGFVYIGGNESFGSNQLNAVIHRLKLESTVVIDQIFPWSAKFFPAGYDALTNDLMPIQPGQGSRELVGMEIDPGTNLLMALWNRSGIPTNACNSPEKANGPGAYLAAVPLGNAPFLDCAIANPFPMERSANGVTSDNSPIYAAGLGLDPKQKTLLVIPREQKCDNSNPYARQKNYISLLSYLGQGIRVVDSLNPIQIWTGSENFYSAQVLNVVGKNFFFLPMATNQVTEFDAGSPPSMLNLCPVATHSSPSLPWKLTREVKLIQVEGFGYQQEQNEPWVDGRITLKPESVPLSAYMIYLNSRPPMIHSRANFGNGLSFVQPDYEKRLDSALGPVYTTGARTIPLQTNAPSGADGLYVSPNLPKQTQPVTLNSGDSLEDQRIIYPQDSVTQIRDIKEVKNGDNEKNIENGHRVLEGGAEFWIRFGNLAHFDPTNFAVDGAKKLMLYENFTKVRAELQRPQSTPPGPGLVDTFHSPFFSVPVFWPAGADTLNQQKTTVKKFLAAAHDLLGYDLGGIDPMNSEIESFEFTPDSMEVWVYDRIFLTNIQGTWPNLTASVNFDRRLAGVAGQYPGIYQSDITKPLGTYNGAPAEVANQKFSHPFAGQPLSKLDQPEEYQKYPIVKIKWQGISETKAYRFVPIWSATELTNSVVTCAVHNVALHSDQWLRIAYASKLNTFVISGPIPGPFITPSEGEGTQLRVWDFTQDLPKEDIARTAPNTKGWFEFPGNHEGFLSFGAYEYPVEGYPDDKPGMGGPVVPGFSYTVSNVIFYERPEAILTVGVPDSSDPFSGDDCQVDGSDLGNLLGQWGGDQNGCPSPMDANGDGSVDGADLGLLLGDWGQKACAAVKTASCFGYGEGGWPGNTVTTFPGGNQSSSGFLPPRPFLDFNGDGIVNDASSVAFWDLNKNKSWDFGEPPKWQGDPQMEAGSSYGEPFIDLNNDGVWTAVGDRFSDLNGDGVMTGEPFLDLNDDKAWQPNEPFVDLNNNGQFDGGEPYQEVNGIPGYQRGGEIFADSNSNGVWDPGEPFQDSNNNGIYDAGEPFVSWSHAFNQAGVSGVPRGGELYRGYGAYENGSVYNFSSAPQWNEVNFPALGQSTWSSNTPSPDWNNDGSYSGNGTFQGVLKTSIPAGSRLDAVNFTVWRPHNVGEVDVQGRVAVDLDFYSEYGSFLGRWAGVDNLALGGTNILQSVDESGIGLPVATPVFVRYRINFLMPNSQLDQSAITRPTSPPVFDDLTLTVTLPATAQTIYDDRIVQQILIRDFEKGDVIN